MLTPTDLKSLLHRADFGQLDKLMMVLASFDQPVRPSNIKVRAAEAGFKVPKQWNISGALGRSKGLALNTPSGWELSEAGKSHLRGLGVGDISPVKVNLANDLRSELVKIRNADTRAFVEEAIACYEFGLHRSAVVMSWVGAVSVLLEHVHAKHLAVFNAEAKRVDAKWKDAKSTDDLARMKEADFLDRLVGISVIGKNVKDGLAKCLKLRNGCGHPNSMKVGTNMVASHIETLLLNVFAKF